MKELVRGIIRSRNFTKKEKDDLIKETKCQFHREMRQALCKVLCKGNKHEKDEKRKNDSKHEIKEYIIRDVLNATEAKNPKTVEDIAFGYPDHSEIESVIAAIQEFLVHNVLRITKHRTLRCYSKVARDVLSEYSAETLWKNCCGILLKKKHKSMLLSSDEWLDDDVINAVQFLLKQKYKINGFQATLLSETLTMEPQRGAFVQVLIVRKSHWITVSTLGCPPFTINIYDSLHEMLPEKIKNLIADLMQSQHQTITVNYMNVQRQSNNGNCGPFALAFAASLCQQQDPTKIAYEECNMRRHLVSCIDNGDITPFPHERVESNSQKKVYRTEIIHVQKN